MKIIRLRGPYRALIKFGNLWEVNTILISKSNNSYFKYILI